MEAMLAKDLRSLVHAAESALLVLVPQVPHPEDPFVMLDVLSSAERVAVQVLRQAADDGRDALAAFDRQQQDTGTSLEAELDAL